MGKHGTGAGGLMFGGALASLAAPPAVDENTIPDGEKLFIAAVRTSRDAFKSVVGPFEIMDADALLIPQEPR